MEKSYEDINKEICDIYRKLSEDGNSFKGSDIYKLYRDYLKLCMMTSTNHPNFDYDWNDVRSDTASEGLSYGLSPFGYASFHKSQLTQELSEYTRFIILYRRLFLKGDTRNEEI